MTPVRLPDTVTALPILLIEAHSRCNCRCAMCDIWKSTASGQFTVPQLEAQLDSLERLGTQWVVFTGGEPLMNPDIFTLSDMLRSRRMRVTVLSSGLLFERYGREITDHIDDVIVSLDGPQQEHDRIRGVPGAYEKITRGIKALHRFRPDFSVGARCTVQKRNHARLLQAALDARAMGLASISFLAADLTSDAFNHEDKWSIPRQQEIALHASEIATLEHQLDELLAEKPFVSDSEPHLRRIARHFRVHLGLEVAEAPRCNAPWVSSVWQVDGSIRPCFFQPTFPLSHHPPLATLPGSVPMPSLSEMLNTPAAREFRHNLDVATNPICQRCVCSLYR